MPARSRAFLRCASSARRDDGPLAQAGAALVTALLTVALVTGIAALLIADFGTSLESVTGRRDLGQARWLARGAIDWGRNVLADDERHTSVDHLNEPWTVKVPPTPVEDGEVSGQLQDRSGCFNLNNLVGVDGSESARSVAAFERLLIAVGASEPAARQAAAWLTDWLDADPVSRMTGGDEASAARGAQARDVPADGPLVHPDELAVIPGFDPALREALRPFVCAVPGFSQLNVNTAPAEVLHALLPGLSLDAARIVVAERERAWFKDVADFNARLPEGVFGFDPAHATARSRFFLATGRARYGTAVVNLQVLLDRQHTWPEILWQRTP